MPWVYRYFLLNQNIIPSLLIFLCLNHKRKRTCNGESINKEFIENVVIDQLIKSLFTPSAIENIANIISKRAALRSDEIQEDIKQFGNELKCVQIQLNNMVNAIAQGMFQPSMKEKMDELEAKKNSIILSLEEAKRQKNITSPSKDLIKAYLQKDADIKSKSLEDQKRIIQTYVQKVIVYNNVIKTYTIVDMLGQTVRKLI